MMNKPLEYTAKAIVIVVGVTLLLGCLGLAAVTIFMWYGMTKQIGPYAKLGVNRSIDSNKNARNLDKKLRPMVIGKTIGEAILVLERSEFTCSHLTITGVVCSFGGYLPVYTSNKVQVHFKDGIVEDIRVRAYAGL